MAISHIGSQGNAGTTVTIPAHQIGDLILIFAYRDGNNTAPTVPAAGGTVPTWTIIGTASGGNTNSSRLHYAVATATNTTSGTWTSATELIAVVYRGTRRPGGTGATGALGTSISYPAVTMQRADNSSWVAGFAGHRTATNVELAPSGMLNRTSIGTEAANHDTNGTVSSWSATAVTVSASSGWRARTVELLDSSLSLVADVGTFVGTFVDGGFAKGYRLIADAGAYTLTGNDATLTAAANPNKFLTADFGSYTFTGVAAGVLHAARLLAEGRAFAVTGNLIDLRPGRRLLAEVRAFSVTGVNATLLPARRLTAESGAFTLTGISADLIKFGGGSQTLVADAGSYTLGLVAVDLNFNRKLLASGTAYTLTGIDAGSRQTHVLVASTRSYQYLGVAANLVYSGQPPQQQANKLRYQFVVLDPLQATVNPGFLGDQVSYYVKDFFRIL